MDIENKIAKTFKKQSEMKNDRSEQVFREQEQKTDRGSEVLNR